MKREVHALECETANSQFFVTIYEEDDGSFVGDWFGTSPKLAGAISPGAAAPRSSDVGSGEVRAASIDAVIAGCRKAIEKLDGPILNP